MGSAHQKTLHKDENTKLGALAPSIMKIAGGVGVVSLVIAVVLGMIQGDGFKRFAHSYLVAFGFVLSIGVGALFFVVLQHLVRARWSVVVRRIAEILTGTFPLLFVLALGVIGLAAAGSLYDWTDDAAKADRIIRGKLSYLNVPFFAVRCVVYFGAWFGISRWFANRSLAQDASGDQAISEKMRVASAPSIIAFALTVAIAAYDLFMSLNPIWYSTIFSVYYFAGSVIAVFATLILVSMALQKSGRLEHAITVEHYHDLGKLLFAFVFFWSYIAFSQFMLQWYADIPEETVWYKYRMFTSWKGVSILLLFGHCVFPFLCLLSRWTKRWTKVLAGFAVWMLVMHYVDLFWLVMPEYGVRWVMEGGHAHMMTDTSFTFGLIDITTLVGLVGLFVAWAAYEGRNVNLVPIKDPALGDSLQFENY